MAAIIVWFLIGGIVYWFFYDLPADPKVADKTQWEINSKLLRALIRISMLLAGPFWIVGIIVTGIYLGSVWLFKLFWRTLTK